MTSDVQICNIALSRIGCQQFLNSLDDPSAEANVCRMVYPFTLERVLQDFPWPFATRYAALQDIGSPVPPWGYRYRYPLDCIQARRVLSQSSVSSSSPLQEFAGGTAALQATYPAWLESNPFVVIADDANNARAILCDLAAPMLEYTARITSVGMFPPAFSNALAWAIAAEIATPLSADVKYAQVANQTYGHALAEAGSMAFGESCQSSLPDGELLSARNE